jgi:glycosyltransferase involved in cell wall biosynthesis
VGYALARARGRPGWIGAQLIRFVEFASLRLAAAVVVRGTFHKDLLAQQGVASVHVLREGIDLDFWRRTDDTPLRRRLDLGDNLCVGVAGSINWNRRRGVCYGWDLIEAMGRIEPTVPIRAIVVGDGDGLPRLQRRARKLGIEGRVRFVGRVPHDEMPQYLSLFDVALSTQTNDVVGRVRTTQKLPEYMAAGCYVLATDVGEARLLLPPEMRLPFDGVEDAAYPERLARRLEELASLGRQRLREETLEIVERARTELDFRVLSVQLAEILDEVRHGGRADSGTPVAEEAA